LGEVNDDEAYDGIDLQNRVDHCKGNEARVMNNGHQRSMRAGFLTIAEREKRRW
jgi:hypothetical protein